MPRAPTIACALALAIGCGSSKRESHGLGDAPFAASTDATEVTTSPPPKAQRRLPAPAEPESGDERPLLLRQLPVVDFAPALSSEDAGAVQERYRLALQYLESREPEKALALLAELATTKECPPCRAMVGRSRWDDSWRAHWSQPIYHVILEHSATLVDSSQPSLQCPEGSERRGQWRPDNTGTLWCETTRGRRHGRYLEVASDGAVDGAYFHGEKHGLWIIETEETTERSIYSRGKRDGIDVHISNRTGRIVRQAVYRRGRRHGAYKEWHDLDKLPYGLKLEGHYRGGKKHGTWSYFDPHGSERVRQSFRHGVRQGRFSYWDDAGRLIRSVVMKRGSGDWVAYDIDSRKIEEGRIVHGRRVGMWSESEQGLAGWRHGRYRAGKRVGLWTFYGSSRDRKVAEGYYRDGRRSGGWSYWHDNGVLASAGPFARDVRHGEWVVFNPSGQVAQKLEFRRGTLVRVNGIRATATMRRRLREADVGRGPTLIEIGPR